MFESIITVLLIKNLIYQSGDDSEIRNGFRSFAKNEMLDPDVDKIISTYIHLSKQMCSLCWMALTNHEVAKVLKFDNIEQLTRVALP